MKKILIKRSDGGVSIMHLVKEDVDINKAIADWESSFKDATCIGHCEINESDMPSDRTFRDAWVQNGSAVAVSMPKARMIHMDRIRKERKRRLEELDKETMRHRTNQQKLDEVETKKQVLRDLPAACTAAVDACATPEELKLVQKDFIEGK